MTAPDTVRVSRRLVEKIVERHDGRYANVITYDDCEQLRAALSTPPASQDAGRVERPKSHLETVYENMCEVSIKLMADFCWPLDATPHISLDRTKTDAALAAPSAPEDKGEGVKSYEITAAEIIDKFNRADWSLNDDNDGLDDVACELLRRLIVDALRAAASNTERNG